MDCHLTDHFQYYFHLSGITLIVSCISYLLIGCSSLLLVEFDLSFDLSFDLLLSITLYANGYNYLLCSINYYIYCLIISFYFFSSSTTSNNYCCCWYACFFIVFISFLFSGSFYLMFNIFFLLFSVISGSIYIF